MRSISTETGGATSIMGILTLGAGIGSTITVVAKGREAKEALTALQTLVAEVYGPTQEGQLKVAREIREVFRNTEGVVDVDWTVEAEPYRRKVQTRLSQTLLPGLEREIVTSRVATPLDFRDNLLSAKGAAFGFEPVLTQSAWFRPHNRSDIKNLFLVGAGTHPGAGVPGVLSSARVLDSVAPHATEFASS